MRFLLTALVALLAAACAPDYNWREVRSPEQGYLVMLPGKPAEMTRSIRLQELEVAPRHTAPAPSTLSARGRTRRSEPRGTAAGRMPAAGGRTARGGPIPGSLIPVRIDVDGAGRAGL